MVAVSDGKVEKMNEETHTLKSLGIPRPANCPDGVEIQVVTTPEDGWCFEDLGDCNGEITFEYSWGKGRPDLEDRHPGELDLPLDCDCDGWHESTEEEPHHDECSSRVKGDPDGWRSFDVDRSATGWWRPTGLKAEDGYTPETVKAVFDYVRKVYTGEIQIVSIGVRVSIGEADLATAWIGMVEIGGWGSEETDLRDGVDWNGLIEEALDYASKEAQGSAGAFAALAAL